MTQFKIECRSGGHSITSFILIILPILVAKPKLLNNLYFYKQYILNVKIHFSLLKSGEMLLSVAKNGQFEEIVTQKVRHTFFL